MKKLFAIVLAGIFVLAAFTGCSDAPAGEGASLPADAVTLKVGASPTPHAEILEACKELMAEKGYKLEIVQFSDYVQPNLALEDKQLDANYFQHQPYLDNFNVEHETHLVSVYAPHYEPFGIYPGKTKSLEELADGATVAVPNDVTNEARALLLLEANGLVKLDPKAGLEATKKDIIENPKNLNIQELEAAQLPLSIQDVDIAAINGNYAVQANLNAAGDALAIEASDSETAKTYANVIAIREGDESRPEIQALVEVLKSQTIKDFINNKYSGAVVPMD